MEELEPEPLSQPMTSIEREHRQMMGDQIWKIREDVLIDRYYHNLVRLDDTEDFAEAQKISDILNILYCELTERGIEFMYEAEKSKIMKNARRNHR